MTEVAKEFATPDRSHSIEEKRDGPISLQTGTRSTKPAATVTPPESGTREEMKAKEDRHSPMPMVAATSEVDSPEERKVHFDKEGVDDAATDSPSSTGSQRGLVSRRGGRCGSPGRTSATTPLKETVLEFKTYRSPPRQRRGQQSSSDTSNEKGGDETLSKGENASTSLVSTATNPTGAARGNTEGSKKGKGNDKRNGVSFSPVPPPKDGAVRTPSKSPTGGRFQSLPILDDDALRSPGSFFLSPNPATPSSRMLKSTDSFDKMETAKASTTTKSEMKQAIRQPMRSPKTPRSPRTPRRDDRDRFLTTPTDFTMDYGKHPHSGSFDSSNVLAWLQSPTANGLFSPGGFSSVLNTPRVAPRTPRTPTVSTSFFFSDVAGLPQSTDTSPKPGGETKRGGGRGVSNIICISPLASSKSKNGVSSSLTPTINYKDMFASPEKSRGMPLLEESPLKSSKSRLEQGLSNRDPSIDAVQMAERELMEDADLSVLLQLASNTPKANGERSVAVSTSDGTNVFRSPEGQRVSQGGGDGNLPSLQLPIIGGSGDERNSTRLARKTHSRDHGDGGESFHNSLSMRSSSMKDDTRSKSKKVDSKKSDKRSEAAKHDPKPPKTSSMYPHHPAYPMPPHPYAHPDAPPYYPPGIPPHAGSMRVVVGGPPPSRTKSTPPRSPHRRPYPMGPGDPNYPPPPYPPPPGHYPHHHAVPAAHIHPHYGHYPPPHHPPPRHMPMYGAQHPAAKSKSSKKAAKIASKPTSKRPTTSQVQKPGSAKKQKKNSPSGGTKKKNRSPQITDKAERQKAAATIQAVNQASGGKNDKAAALAAAILRGVTMRPSGKWQAQLYFAGKSRYIGVFDTREKAALAYEIAREKLKAEKQSAEGGTLNAKATEAAVNAARKAAFEGVNERDPRLSGS